MKEQIEEQAIEEMAKLACTCFDGNCKECPFDFYPPCPTKASAKRIYNAGYRKQSEGKWIIKGLANPKCSACNSYNRCGDKSDYCPNCGAKMKGGAE